MSSQIALLLDGLILIFLCVTIFYAARLSMFLKTFREGRAGMQILIRDLTTTIAKAEVSINTTKRQMSEAEQELRTVINEAKFLSDELRYMNEGGDSLANRLEKLADRNRELIDLMEKSGGIGTQAITPFDPAKEASKKVKSKTLNNKVKKPVEQPLHFEVDEAVLDNDLDLEEGLDDDDEMDFQALEDGAYREEMAALRREILKEDDSFEDEVDTNLDAELFEEDDDYEEDSLEEEYQPRIDTNAKSKVRSFAIFDRELAEIDLKERVQEKIEQDVDDHSSEFYSKAEQDLYEALQRRKKMKEKSS